MAYSGFIPVAGVPGTPPPLNICAPLLEDYKSRRSYPRRACMHGAALSIMIVYAVKKNYWGGWGLYIVRVNSGCQFRVSEKVGPL